MSAAVMEYSDTLLLIHRKLFKGSFSLAERDQMYLEARELLFENKVPPENSKLCAKTLNELESRYPELTCFLISGKVTSIRWC